MHETVNGNAVSATSYRGGQANEHYDRFGYVVIPGAVDPEVIDDHLAGLEEFERSHPHLGIDAGMGLRDGIKRLRARHQFQASHESTLRLQFAPKLVETIREILGDDPVPLFTTTFRFSPLAGRVGRVPELSPHLHNFEVVTHPKDKFIFAWVAFENVRANSGPMWIQPGSHKAWGDFPLRLAEQVSRFATLATLIKVASERSPTLEIWSELLEQIADVAREIISKESPISTLTPEPVLLKKGDAIVFSPSLLHGTLPPSDSFASRGSCNIRYLAKNCHAWNYLHFIPCHPNNPPLDQRIFLDVLHTEFGSTVTDFLGAKYRHLML